MVSVCVIYSNERWPQAQQLVKYLQSLPYADTFDFIQVCDGPFTHKLSGFRQIVVERRNPNFFCRADLWHAAATTASRPIMIILDCDRIAHFSFFRRAFQLPKSHILYCPRLYQLLQPESLETILSYYNKPIPPTFAKPDFKVTPDLGTIQPAKNPMSGCVAFHRDDFLATPGLSAKFIGWGFNDTDYYMYAYFNGFVFETIDLPEFHLHHGYEVSRRRLLAMNAWNSVRFYDKWSMPIPICQYQLFEYLQTTPEIIRQTQLEEFLTEVGG